MISDKKIFITGSTSKIGRFLVKSLLEKGCSMILLCRGSDRGLKGPGFKLVYGDLLDRASYISSLRGIDTVLHMAAVTHTNDIKKYYKVNSEATLDLARACKENGVKRFIFLSTRAISEKGGDYSKSKLLAEHHVKESGLDWVIMRFSEIYGVSGKEGIDMLLNNIHKYPFIPIIGNGQYKLAPVCIKDVISSIISVLENEDKNSRIYNIAGPQSFTYKEFIDKLLALKRIRRLKMCIPLPLFKTAASAANLITGGRFLAIDQLPRFLSEKSADISLAVKELGFKPVEFEEAIKRGW